MNKTEIEKDKAEKINKIVWRVDGKVKEIQRMTGSTKWLKFDYDAMGNRIAKHVYNNTGTTHERSTYYILDAQGNQISTYDHEIVGGSAKFHLKERNIFGSSRIGSKQDSINILTATITQNYTQVIGTKYYEFSNHLGNVLTVFSDVKIALDEDADYVVDGFRVPIRNIADYSPFGVQLDGRTISMDSYRYGYQNQEKDDEIKGAGNSVNYKYRMHDPRIGRFFAVDPLAPRYPHNSSYAFSENRVIDSRELEGLELALANIGDASNKGTGYLIICHSEDTKRIAQQSIEGTMFDFMYVTTLEDGQKYLKEYMTEHNLESINYLIDFTHAGKQGVPIERKKLDSEKGNSPYVIDKISSVDLKQFVEGSEMTDGDKYSTGIFIDNANKVKTGGMYVQVSCNVRVENGDWGENLSKATGARFNIFTNGDLTAIQGNLFNSALTDKANFNQGWFTYPEKTGCEEPLNNSLMICDDGFTLPVPPKEIKR